MASSFNTCLVVIDPDRNDCFISIPHSFTNNQEKPVFSLQSVQSDVTVYCGWNGKLSRNVNSVEIAGTFASLAGLTEGETVILSSVTRLQTCQKLVLSPLTPHDWSLIQQNADHISLSLMDQVFSVWQGMVIPIHLQSNLLAKAKVISMTPNNRLNCIGENTEVHFESEGSETSSEETRPFTLPSLDPSKSFLTSLLGSMFKSSRQSQETNSSTTSKERDDSSHYVKLKSFPSTLLLRHLPTDALNSAESQINTVYISSNQFFNFSTSIAQVSIIFPPYDGAATASDQEGSKKRPTSTVVLVTPSEHLSTGQCYLSCCLQKQLGINGFLRIILSPLVPGTGKTIQQTNNLFLSNVHKVQVATALQLIPLKPCTLSSIDLLNGLDEITPENGILVTDGTLVTLKANDFLVKSDTCLMIKQKSIEQVTVLEYESSSVLNLLPKPLVFASSKANSTCQVDTAFYGFKSLIEKFSSCIASALKVDRPYTVNDSCGNKSSFIALIGARGSGKTHLIKHCIAKYIQPPHSVVVKWIDCKILRGRRVDALNKLLLKELTTVMCLQPAILILEDLNHFTSSCEKPAEASNVELFYLNRVARLLIHIKHFLHSTHQMYGQQLLVIATAYDEASLHEAIIKSTFFHSIYHLKPPQADDRKEIISGFIASSTPPVQLDKLFPLDSLVQKTEGYLPVDLKILLNQAIHYTLMCNSSANETGCTKLQMKHFLPILDSYTPLNLRKIKFAPPSTVTLSSVGGLDQVKQTLIETIEWSSKYPNLMAKCPLRPASCILLYGAPGTGKTLLAQAIANHTKVNFLSISGPELLSKYIGASELAIRDLFASAEAAKPCIVFFDEFDSIAPRRGHDSTGVTDRVVNQLLTQMDGVEGIDRSIFILAATSRPDLLDPALLRPGRFDLTVHCNLPDTPEDRLSILKSIALNINLAPDVDLSWLAQQTDGYTGADLHAIMYTAQMTSARHFIKQGTFNIDRHSQQDTPSSSFSSSSTGAHCTGQLNESNFLILDAHLHAHQVTNIPDEMMCTLSKLKIIPDTSGEKETCHSDDNVDDIANTDEYAGGNTRDMKSVLIQQMNIKDALESTNPSIGSIEREKYTKIYHEFQLGRMKQPTSQKRVTLA